MAEVVLSSKGQVVIPKETRERLGLVPGTSMLLLEEGDTIILRRRPESFTDALQGLGKELWLDADALIEQERASWE
jgi:AbrB family looped-hinge helix DNA binding protein